MHFLKYLSLAALLLAVACRPSTAGKENHTQTRQSKLVMPEDNFGQLFADVQMGQVFPDGKTFVDCTPKYPVADILAKYEKAKTEPNFDLKAFVKANFYTPHLYSSNFKADTSRSAEEHINALWPVLTRNPDQVAPNSTLIPLPHPYVVPGGRFGEVYYWDSYFTMLGLQSSGRIEMIGNMVDNFAHLIDSIGFIPNGNRTYYLTRSQPPFFAAMVQLLATARGNETYTKYLPQLEKEYAFWMKGLDKVSATHPAELHVVRLKDGTILNRYFDRGTTPRAEMYRSDVETAKSTQRPAEQVYSDIRSACESGWDFSSRWLADPSQLSTIHTTEIIPVDLNSLLFNLEQTIARAYAEKGDQSKSQDYTFKALTRQRAVYKYCWDVKRGYFADYDFVKGATTPVLSLAGMYPLYFHLATPEQAKSSTQVVEKLFLRPGGLQSTANTTGQQWDAPNGWAPLQWMTIQGLRNYQQDQLANTIKDRWTKLNVKVYKATGKMVEKYNVADLSLIAGGGEYPVQDGFGWSNGVLLKLLSEKKKPLKD
jgi:alpha,alpha-trehalase